VNEPSTSPNVTRLGDCFARPPVPAVPERTRNFNAGAVTIGVEYRLLTTEIIERSYAGEVQLEADDRGISVHVFDTDTGLEHLRFDDFDDDKHYHYIFPDGTHIRIGFDSIAQGEMLPWVLGCIRGRLPEMLTFAGAGSTARRVELATIDAVLGEVTVAAQYATASNRSGSI